MTEPLQPSSTPPPKDGKGCTNQSPLTEAFKKIIEQSGANGNTPNPSDPSRCFEPYDATVRRQRAKTAYDASGLPLRHRMNAGELRGVPEWSEARDKVCDRLGHGFLLALIGDRGPGKTQIAEQAVRAICERLSVDESTRPPARYIRAMDLFLSIRASYRKDAEHSEIGVLDQFRRPQLLVIDEIQERGDTNWEDRMLTNLIDNRYGDFTDTLLIANLTPAALRESVGPSIYDRLCETGGIIECNWQSFRASSRKEPAPF